MARPHELLVALARQTDLPPVDESARLVDSALEHRMTGLLWDAVSAGNVGLDPRHRARLQEMDVTAWAKHALLWSTFERVQDLLAARGMEVLLVKGVAAESVWYERLGQRPCADLDLLLPPDSAERVDEILDVLTPEHPLIGVGSRLAQQQILLGLEIWVDGVPVDLHLDLLKNGPPSRNPEMYWRDSVATNGPGGIAAQTLSPEMALIHFAYHLNRDRFRYLGSYLDLARILESDTLDWAAIDLALEAEGLRAPVYETLATVREDLHLDISLPTARGWRQKAWRRAWPTDIRLRGQEGMYRWGRRSQLLLPVLTRGQTIRFLRWQLRRAVPPREWLEYRHPRGKGPYAWRLIATRTRHALYMRKEGRKLAPSDLQ